MIIKQFLEFEDVKGMRIGWNPIGKPFLYVYVYYVDGLMIDTGQRKAGKDILRFAEKLPVDQIYVTHHHEDHSGNIEPLRQLHNCNAYASSKCCEMMKDPPPISYAQRLTWGKRPNCYDLIPKDDFVQTDKYKFEIIPITGHAPDMVALYEPNKKWLFSADLFINTYIDYFLFSESVLKQIASIDKVLKLDFEVMFCNHKPQLKDPKQKLIKKRKFLADLYEKVVDLHKQGKSPKQIMATMKWKENRLVNFLSGGKLSKINIVKSAIRDFESH